jgi:excinuclease ABC subunit A
VILSLHGVRPRSLQGVNIDIPLHRLTVVRGPSGAGKGSLLFHTLYAESYSRYLEALSLQFRKVFAGVTRPGIDSVVNLPPAVAFPLLDPPVPATMTVAEAVDLEPLIRLLFAKGGRFRCPVCRREVDRYTIDEMVAEIRQGGADPVYICFDFEGTGAELRARGYANHWHDNGRHKIPATGSNASFVVIVDVVTDVIIQESRLFEAVEQALAAGGNRLRAIRGGREWIFSNGYYCSRCRIDHSGMAASAQTPAGSRRPPHFWSVAGVDYTTLISGSGDDAERFLGFLDEAGRGLEACRHLVSEIRERIGFLQRVGLGKIPLDRPAGELSWAATRMMQLAVVMGSTLADALILIEHPLAGLDAGNRKLMRELLAALRQRNNTVVVADHDPELANQADHLIELGPGAGASGGKAVYSGSGLLPGNRDGLSCPSIIPTPVAGPADTSGWLTLDVNNGPDRPVHRIQLARPGLVLLAGRNGCGKTRMLSGIAAGLMVGGHRVLRFVPERNAGPGEVVAAAIDLLAPLRRFFASQPQSRVLGYSPAHFSHLSPLGRCPECRGRGELEIDMGFLPPAAMVCPTCGGRRFHSDILKVTCDRLSIHDVLQLDLAGYAEWSREKLPGSGKPVARLVFAGLGHLRGGQDLQQLSVGEYRLLRAMLVLGAKPVQAFVLLDNPGLGLSDSEVVILADSMRERVSGGGTVVVAEHHRHFRTVAEQIIEL